MELDAVSNRQGTAGGGIRPDMRITKRNALPCAVRQDNH